MGDEPQTKIQKDETTQIQQQKPESIVEEKQHENKIQETEQKQQKQQKKQQIVMLNESNLLQSQLITAQIKIQTNFHDQQPIGGGNKFQLSQFPQQGQSFKPVPKKLAAKKASKKISKLQQTNNQNVNMQNNSKIFNEDAPLLKQNNQPLDELPIGGNNKKKFTEFDEKPITAAKNSFNMSEFPEGEQMPAQQTEYPMLQKLKSKAAKLRLSGMQELLKLLEQNPDHPDIDQTDVKSMVKETAPANLQKGLQVLKVWIEKGKRWGDEQIKNSIENGMAKNITKKKTLEICDCMYEQNPNMVQASILIGMKSKIAKNIALYVTVIYELLAIYGINRMKYLKPYIPEIVKILNDKKDVAIKTQCLTVLKQSYKWLGKDVISPMLGDLKQNLKKQLDSFWDSYDQNAVMKAPKGQEAVDEGGNKKKKKVDAYDLSQAVDVFKKFNQKWTEGVINAPKWSEKVKMLEQFVKAASVPKLANTQFRHISELIKRLINDSNFNVVIWDMKVLACLSRGLRRHFYHVVKNTFSQVLAKFRDKKTQMIQQTFTTLSDFMYCISLDDVLDDIKEGLKDKAPNMKVNLLNWISKFIQAKAEQKGEVPDKILDSLKTLFTLFQKLLNDGNVQVRDCMARNIFKMKLSTGVEFFYTLESKMNRNLVNKAATEPKGVKGKEPTKKQKTPEKQMSKAGVSFKKIESKKQQLQKQMNKSQILAKKSQKKASQPELKLQRFEQISFDDCCIKLVEMGFPEEQIKNIKASGAKQRTNVMNILKTERFDLLTTFTVIRQLFKDWKQVNLLMNKQLLAFIEQKSEQIEKPELMVLIPFIIEKIGDTKFSQSLFRAIEKICHRIPSVFIIGYFIEKIKAQDFKKPKLNSDVCTCVCRIIEIVSASNIPLRETILFGNECFKNQFAKKSGLQLLKKIYSYIGEQIKIYLEAETYTAIQAQLKKTNMVTEEEKKPKIQFFGQAKKTQKAVVNLLQNKPKVDITQDILKLLPKMNDNANWQNRKQSAEAIINLINDNFGRVTIQCMNDLMNSLKVRINDSNKQLIKIFMQLSGVLFPVLNDKQLKLFTKPFVLTIADGLSDKMQGNKKQANLTLARIGQVVGKEHLLAMLSPYLQTDKESRIQIINIMLSNEEYLNKTDMKDFAKGITNCLCDKNKDIRNTAEKLFEKVYEKIGIEVFRNIAKNQKPAMMKDLNLIYDKHQKDKACNYGSQSFISKASSPAKDLKMSNIKPPSSAQKKSVQKNYRNYTSSIQIDHQDIEPITTHSRIKVNPQLNNYSSVNQLPVEPQRIITYVQGDQLFAPLKILTQFRVERQEKPSWRCDEIRQEEQDNVKDQITLLFRLDVSKKMLSFSSKRTSDAALGLIKLCKDVTYQNHFRQIYDLLIKWALMRLWGGNPSLMYLVQMIPPILSILQKKKLALSDAQVDLIISLNREYLLSAHINESKVSESLHIIVKSLIALSSGERVLRKILRQFNFELTAMHRHLKKEANTYYRDGLSKITKIHLMDCIGNQQMLEEASKIKQLRSDPEFVDILYKKFHEGILNNFGFRSFAAQSMNSIMNANSNSNYQQAPLYQTHAASFVPRIERDGHNERDKSAEKNIFSNSKVNIPQQQNMVANKSPIFANKHAPPIPINSTHSSSIITSHTANNVNKGIQISPVPQRPDKIIPMTNKMPQNEFQNNQNPRNKFNSNCFDDIDLLIYPSPHPISPLGKNLAKLLPYNEQTIRFFTQLFSEHGQKITNELTIHAKIIFASILRSVIKMFQNRNQQMPERIISQMNLFQQCIKCKYIIRNIDDLLCTGINFALKQLVYEDQNKAAIHKDLIDRDLDFKVDQFGKVINGAMLRILQNSNSQQVTNTLIQIQNFYLKNQTKSLKTFCLIVKCTTRAAQTYTSQMKVEDVVKFFILIDQYFMLEPPEYSLKDFQLPTKQKPKPEQNFLNVIKSIILELGKVLNSDIWQIYERAMRNSKNQDNYIAPYIQSLKIRPQQRRQDPRSNNNLRENDEIKKISELLSKNKTFETGILHLKKFCNQNMSFNPVDYFTSLGYDQKFITMVMNSLQGKERRTPRKDSNDGKYNKSKSPINNTSQQQQNISEKIKKLKQKFDQIKPNTITPNVSQKIIQNAMQGRKQSQQSGHASKDERAAQIKRRIDQMKSRLNQNFDKPR